MSAVLQFALSNPTPGMEEEFNEWYGGDHLTHGVKTPGIIAGQRFRRTKGPWPAGKHDYLMIWEFDDPAFTLAELAKVKGTQTMPISPAINMDTVQPPTMWRRAEFRSTARPLTDTASRQSVIFGLYNAAEGEDQAFADALLGGGLLAMADQPGVISAQYLTLAEQQIRGSCYKYPHGILIELCDEAAALAALEKTLVALPHADSERWLAVVFRPIGRRTTKADLA